MTHSSHRQMWAQMKTVTTCQMAMLNKVYGIEILRLSAAINLTLDRGSNPEQFDTVGWHKHSMGLLVHDYNEPTRQRLSAAVNQFQNCVHRDGTVAEATCRLCSSVSTSS